MPAVEEARLLHDGAALVASGTAIEVHGFASIEGSATYNRLLSCARAEKAGYLLAGIGATVTGLFQHGPTPGLKVPHRSVMLHTGAPVCGTAPPAPTAGVPLPRNLGIPSGAQCRGACGPDCPSTCTPLPNQKACVANSAGTCHWIYEYPGVIRCGSHLGCRNHDACYDRCAATRGETDLCHHGGTCHCGCDYDCIHDHTVAECNSWRTGGGPYDSFIEFSNPPTVSGPIPGACPP